MALPKKQTTELINVHRVQGDKDAILYLKNADHEIVEGFFYQAKRFGRAEFEFRDLKYVIERNRDFSFTVRLSDEQEVSTEQFA